MWKDLSFQDYEKKETHKCENVCDKYFELKMELEDIY